MNSLEDKRRQSKQEAINKQVLIQNLLNNFIEALWDAGLPTKDIEMVLPKKVALSLLGTANVYSEDFYVSTDFGDIHVKTRL